jgi:ribosomal protein S18 acetylase RimI-like enzyme
VNDVERAFAFMRRGDIRGSREEPWRFGTAVFTPELPLRRDSNYLLLERPGAAEAIAGQAELVQRGLGYRMIYVPDEQLGERLAAGFESLGWEAGRSVVMVHRRPPARPIDTSSVEEVEEAALRGPRELDSRQYPWASPELVRQWLESRRRIPIEARFFAIEADGMPVSFTDLYIDGDTAQVEAVATLEAYRGRGYASAVVLRAVEEARASGAAWIFLVAEADDWPKEMYRKLGFDDVGRYLKFSRTAGE